MRPEDIVWNQAIAAAIAAYKDGIGAIMVLRARVSECIDISDAEYMEVTDEPDQG